MKITNLKIEKLDDFFDVIKKCKGSVYLMSPDMHINLKSNLAHYISFANLCSASAEEIELIEIVAQEREDIDMLLKFLHEGVA